MVNHMPPTAVEFKTKSTSELAQLAQANLLNFMRSELTENDVVSSMGNALFILQEIELRALRAEGLHADTEG